MPINNASLHWVKVLFPASTVRSDRFTLLAPLTNTTAATGFPFTNPVLFTSTLGGLISARPWPAMFTPLTLRFLVMATCSGYVPGQTLIVSPGLEAFIAVWMLLY